MGTPHAKFKSNYQSFGLQLQVGQLHVAREDADVQILGVQVGDVFAEELVEQPRHCTLQHLQREFT